MIRCTAVVNVQGVGSGVGVGVGGCKSVLTGESSLPHPPSPAMAPARTATKKIAKKVRIAAP